MLTLIGTGKSRAFRVLWMLEELGEPYMHDPAGPRSAAVTAHNASGKIPVLLAEGVALTDSTAILTWLADRAGRLTAPAGSLERARQDGLTQVVLDEMDASLWVAARHSFILPPERRVAAVKDSLKWEFEAVLARMAVRLEGPFLMGEAMTVPDIILTHCLIWAGVAGFPAPEGALADYAARMRGRAAFGRAAGRG